MQLKRNKLGGANSGDHPRVRARKQASKQTSNQASLETSKAPGSHTKDG
jgi:hypothetical protein